jgi:methylated-DNA-[protein]-cysteine S-methyltransferase
MNTNRPHPIVAQAHCDTPLGPIVLAATSHGLAGLWFDGQAHHPGPIAAPENPSQPFIAGAIEELGRYFRGEVRTFRTAVDAAGTSFQHEVWQALRRIPAGATTTYGELAAGLGRPRSTRAVAAAVGRNPVSIVVPCHRVVGRDGALTGYAGGLDRKRRLLEHEGTIAVAPYGRAEALGA